MLQVSTLSSLYGIALHNAPVLARYVLMHTCTLTNDTTTCLVGIPLRANDSNGQFPWTRARHAPREGGRGGSHHMLLCV